MQEAAVPKVNDRAKRVKRASVHVVVQFEKNDLYQGIASAMPPKGVRCNGALARRAWFDSG